MEILESRVNYYYDTNPFNSSYSQNAWGRLTAVTFSAQPVVGGGFRGTSCTSTVITRRDGWWRSKYAEAVQFRYGVHLGQ